LLQLADALLYLATTYIVLPAIKLASDGIDTINDILLSVCFTGVIVPSKL
jgi:hypothetical protein